MHSVWRTGWNELFWLCDNEKHRCFAIMSIISLECITVMRSTIQTWYPWFLSVCRDFQSVPQRWWLYEKRTSDGVIISNFVFFLTGYKPLTCLTNWWIWRRLWPTRVSQGSTVTTSSFCLFVMWKWFIIVDWLKLGNVGKLLLWVESDILSTGQLALNRSRGPKGS